VTIFYWDRIMTWMMRPQPTAQLHPSTTHRKTAIPKRGGLNRERTETIPPLTVTLYLVRTLVLFRVCVCVSVCVCVCVIHLVAAARRVARSPAGPPWRDRLGTLHLRSQVPMCNVQMGSSLLMWHENRWQGSCPQESSINRTPKVKMPDHSRSQPLVNA